MNWRADQRPKRIAGRGAVEVTGPGPDLTVGCSEPGDSGAPAGAGRLRRGFVGAVGVFLVVTGGLKLVSGLQESRVLGAADPVLPWLTMRQVLFLAAVLELGVATVLLRHRAARWTPGLIQWLVGVFGLYQLGQWSAGFQGHCGCLGHLFDRWPGFEVWADRIMLVALASMGLGSVWSFVLSKNNLSGAGCRKGDYKTIFLLMVAVLGSTGGFTKSLPPLAVIAQYRSESFHPGSTAAIHTMELRISIYSSNRWWRIRTDPLNRGLVPVDWMRIPDGVRSHSIVAANPTVTNWSPVAEAYSSTYPVRGDTGLLLAWLAYVPHPELPVLDGRRIRRFLTPELATSLRNEGTYNLEWLAPDKAFLARLSITNNGLRLTSNGKMLYQKGDLSGGWLEFEYIVNETTNLMGITFPRLGTLTHYLVPPDGASDELKPVWIETIRLIEAHPLETIEMPVVPPLLAAVDFRLSKSAQGRSLNYRVTNDVWRPLADPGMRYLAEIQLHMNERSRSPFRSLLVLLLAILMVSPIALYFARWLKRG